MRKIKRITLLITMLAMFLTGVSAFAINPKVYDEAALFSEQEREILEQRAVDLSERIRLDIVIVTITDAEGKTSRDFADDFYDYNGFGYGENYDGLLLLINMEDREVYISTCGKAIEYFTDARIEAVLDEIYTYLSDGNYSTGAEAFLDEVEYYVQKGIPSNQHTVYENPETTITPLSKGEIFLKRLPIYLLTSFVIGGVVVGIMAINNKGKSATNQLTYLEGNSFKIINSHDRHINTTLTHVTIQKSSGGSGKSTVHRSSSGRSHGGGGRKF